MKTVHNKVDRIIAMGDVHGDWEAFSGALKAVGYKVKVLDLDVYPELKKEIVNYNYIMIGFANTRGFREEFVR